MADLDGLSASVGFGTGAVGGPTGSGRPDGAAWADALDAAMRGDDAAIWPGVGLATSVQYSPSRPGYHDYTAGPNVVCPAELRCTKQEIADQMSRFSLPGRSPAEPIQSGEKYPVYDPETGLFVGRVRSEIFDDGLAVRNVTQPGHIFHDGQITRSASQAPDGTWTVTTRGTGNNVYPGMSHANELFGPGVFNGLDARMRANIERHHGVR